MSGVVDISYMMRLQLNDLVPTSLSYVPISAVSSQTVAVYWRQGMVGKHPSLAT